MKNSVVSWDPNLHFKYIWASLRVGFRKVFRSYVFFLVAIISLVIITLIPILTSKSTIDNIEELWFAESAVKFEYTMEERIWIFQSQLLTSFTFGSLLVTLVLILPIMLLLNRVLLNPLRSGIFLIYLSTPVKKSTNLSISVIVSTIFVFIFIALSEIMKYTIFLEVIEKELNREIFGLTQEAINDLKDFYFNTIGVGIGYMLLFSLFLILLIVLLGINFSQMGTSVIVIFFSIVFGPLYLGIQIAFTKIPFFRDSLQWIFQVIAFFWIAAYPIFISFHSQIDVGYLDLSNKIGSKLPNRFYYQPFMFDPEKNETGNIRSFLFLQKEELLLTLSAFIVVLCLLIYIFWRKKRIL